MNSQRNYSLLRKAFGEITNKFGKPLTTDNPQACLVKYLRLTFLTLKPTVVTTTLKKLPNLIRKTTQKRY